MMPAWEGMLLIDKPAGPTSHDVVDRLRRVTGQTRIGHTGTLDPPATGLLILLLGTATRLATYLPSAPKRYEGSFRLGVTTLSDDLAEPVLERHEGALPADAAVRAESAKLVGRGWQSPPSISARHVAGRRLYRAARRGVLLSAPAREIEVDQFDVMPSSETGLWTFESSVSSGTYVRALVRDLGAALGCGAAVASLRRTGIGALDVADAVPVDRVEGLAKALTPIDRLPLSVPSTALDAQAADGFRHGRIFESILPEGTVAVRDGEGALIGIGEVAGGRLKPRVVLVAGGEAAVITSARSSS